jgi:hypothetical protein
MSPGAADSSSNVAANSPGNPQQGAASASGPPGPSTSNGKGKQSTASNGFDTVQQSTPSNGSDAGQQPTASNGSDAGREVPSNTSSGAEQQGASTPDDGNAQPQRSASDDGDARTAPPPAFSDGDAEITPPPRGFRSVFPRISDPIVPVLGLAILDAVNGEAPADGDAAQGDDPGRRADANASAPDTTGARGADPDQDTPMIGDVTGSDVLTPMSSLLGTATGTAESIGNNAIDGFNAIEAAADEIGDPGASVVRAATGFAEAAGVGQLGDSNLLSAVAGAPAATLDGRAVDAVHDLLWETAQTTIAAGDAVNRIVDAVKPVAADLIQSAADAVGDVLDNIQNGSILESSLVDLSGDGDDMLGAVLNPSSSGAILQLDAQGDGNPSQSNNLIDLGLGPRNQHQGSVDVLNPVAGGNAGAIEVNVLDVGPDGPRLLDADLATNEDILDFATIPAVTDESTNPVSLPHNAAIVDSSAGDLTHSMPDLATGLVPVPAISQTPFDLHI